MLNVMIDLETLGTSPAAPILSIGAVYFDPDTGELGPELHVKLDFEEACEDRKIDPATVKWWLCQSDEARSALLDDQEGFPIIFKEEALDLLSEFIHMVNGDAKVWGNGATFDISMLEDLYRQLGEKIPWKFYNVRDVRTVVALAEGIVDRSGTPFEGTQHNALADAVHQATYVSTMWQALRLDRGSNG